MKPEELTKLREAAERLRRRDAGVPLLDIYPKCRDKPKSYAGEWNEWRANEQALAWLASDQEFLADYAVADLAEKARREEEDKQPVTEEWFRNRGGVNVDGDIRLGRLSLDSRGTLFLEPTWGHEPVIVCVNPTIGQVNHLLAALEDQ